MVAVPTYEVNAFTGPGMTGNPAAVCLLESWPEDAAMLAVARRHNLSETAFLVPADAAAGFDYHLRWFTTEVEVDLCGHATLAAAHILYSEAGFSGDEVSFNCQVGRISSAFGGSRIWLDFPSRDPHPDELPPDIMKAIGGAPKEVRRGERDYLLVYGDQAEVEALAPDFEALSTHGLWGYVATAPGRDVDFVSRCFFPAYGIDEDPVTGSAHCVSGPYWAAALEKDELTARQISPRGGELQLKIDGERVFIGGQAETVSRGEIDL